jgi:predicted transposase/invertase (TIGR01784 family)
MHRPIDPKVDCVFKTLFGSDDHRDLLIHFLNALLADDLAAPITDVDILNPYNERETLDDKLTVVDVKARDAARRLFQIEIQLLVFANLAPRILYAWADLFSQQLQRGGDYRALQPVYAIWILDGTLFRERPEYAHRYRWRDDRGRLLLDHGTIRVFELSKFDVEPVQSDAERWLRFLKDGETLDSTRLPAWMQPPIMRSAMSTLNAFSEKERDYHRYQSRQEALRVQRAVAYELEERRAAEQAALQAAQDALQAKEAALQDKEAALQDKEAERQAKEAERQAKEAERQAKEAALQAKEAALAEIERLQALLDQQSTG